MNILFSQNYTAPDSTWIPIQGVSSNTQATSVNFVFTTISTAICPSLPCAQAGNGNFIDAVTAGQQVPGPLPLMGAATAFAYGRKIRRRIKQATH